MKRKFGFWCLLWTIGGVLYAAVELLWRRSTHWTMVAAGGICFCLLFKIFQKLSACALWIKCCIGSAVITAVELVFGFVLNFLLRWRIWDYSHLPMNFCGQICLLYSFLWGLLTLPVVFLCRILQKGLNRFL